MAEQVIQRAFIGGEIAPALRARADIARYFTSLALCENFFVRPQGGAYSRPGTRFVGELGDVTRRGRLIPFAFNTEQTYILVFEHEVMRVIMDGGFIESGGSVYSIVTPYTEDELPRLVFTQDADVMTITHPNHNPKNLSRTGHASWSLADINYASSVTAPTGVTVAAVGTASTLDDKTYRYVVTAIDEDGVESLPSSEVSHTIAAMTTTYGSRITWTAVAGAQFYRVYRDPSNGSGVYGWVGDTKNEEFEDYNVTPVTSDAPPSEYLPFANANSKPATVGYYQQRQVFANTLNEPQKVFCSQSGIYNSMRYSSPARSDDALFFTIKANQVNEIRHIVDLDALVLLTSGGEWKVTEGQDQVLTPSTLGVRRQSQWGASWCRPATVGDSVIFVQEKGTRVRDLTYAFADGKYQGNELSVMAQHLLDGYDIEEMTYALEPYGILWCVRDDGTLLGMTYQREHEIWAWHQHTTDGTFESVASISEDGRDAVYVIVKRTINGTERRYVERMEPRYDDAPENVWCVDCGLQYEGAATTTITGLSHLEDADVVAVADGNVVENLTVSGGQIILPRAAEKVTVGLPYTCAIELLEMDVSSMQQSLRGREISVSKVTLEVDKSRGGWVGTRQEDGSYSDMMEIKPRFDSDGYDPLQLKSFKQDVVIQPEWNTGGGLRIEQRTAMPLTILSVIPSVDIS